MRGPLFSADNARPWLARLDPRVKVLWIVAVSIVAVSVDRPEHLALLACVAAAAALGLKLQSRGWLAIVALLLLTMWSTMLSQGFFYHLAPTRTAILTIIAPSPGDPLSSGLVLSREGMTYGAVQSLRLVATALAGFTACLSTGPERLLAALTWLRLPTSLAFMTTAALRFVPLLIEEAAIVRQARRLRGYARRGGWLASIIELPALVYPVLASAVRKAETLAESITARGFDPRAPRTFYPPLIMRTGERLLTAAIIVACTAIVTARWAATW